MVPRFVLIAAFATAAGLLAIGCSGEPGFDDFVGALREARTDLDQADAECVVGELRMDFSDAELAALISTVEDSGEAGPDVAKAGADRQRFATAQFQAVRTCGLQNQVSPDLVDSFAFANDVSAETATCAVGRLQEQFGFWELTDRLIEDDETVRFQRRQFEAIFECGDRTAIAEQLRPQLVTQGVAADDAECVSNAIADNMSAADLSVLYSGSTTDAFYSVYFESLETCGALP